MMKKTLLTLVCTFVALCASTQNTFQLKTSGTDPQLLVVQYSGEDKPEKGKKFLFNISVNGTLLYTEGLNRNRHGLFEIVYPIPDSVLQGKSSALVRFEAYDETASVGKIYDVSIVRQKLETGIFTDRKNWISARAICCASIAPSTGAICAMACRWGWRICSGPS